MALATGCQSNNGFAPAGAADEDNSPKVALFVFHAAASEKLELFLLKRPCAVMFLLILNIFTHHRSLGRAHSECAVAFLPLKAALADFLVHPARGNAFDLTHDIREAVSRAKPNEQMHMVADTAHAFRRTLQLFDHPTEEGMETFAPIQTDHVDSLFGAQNEVVVERKMSRRHVTRIPATLPGRNPHRIGIRWLVPPANLLLALPGLICLVSAYEARPPGFWMTFTAKCGSPTMDPEYLVQRLFDLLDLLDQDQFGRSLPFGADAEDCCSYSSPGRPAVVEV